MAKSYTSSVLLGRFISQDFGIVIPSLLTFSTLVKANHLLPLVMTITILKGLRSLSIKCVRKTTG